MARLAHLDEGLMKVAIVGAGYAGLAAAVELARKDVPVVLFEAGKSVGGRARAVSWRDIALDNGQHLLLGAYSETLRLMDVVGTASDNILRLPLELTVPGRFELRTPSLPAPLHLIGGLLSARGLGWSERLQAIRFAVALRLRGFRLDRDQSVAALLARYGQDGDIGRLLWEPLCLAALNTPPSLASAQVFLNVLRDSFSHARSDSDLILPRVDLTSLFPAHAVAFIQKRGAIFRRETRIRAVEQTGNGFHLSWNDGAEAFSHVVCATAPQHALTLLPERPELARTFSLIRAFSYQPIATVYLQYPPSVRLERPLLGLSGDHAQWVFDHGWTHGTPGLLAAVISAEGPFQALGREQLCAAVHSDLTRALDLPPPLWARAITEKRATFACSVAMKRPHQATGMANLFLAGDYTEGDYPATLEGAVRSGVECAKLTCGIP